MIRDLESFILHMLQEFFMLPNPISEGEKCRRNVVTLEDSENLWRVDRVWSVIEGDGNMFFSGNYFLCLYGSFQSHSNFLEIRRKKEPPWYGSGDKCKKHRNLYF